MEDVFEVKRNFIAFAFAFLLAIQYIPATKAAYTVTKPLEQLTTVTATIDDWCYANNHQITTQWVNPGSYAGPCKSEYLINLSNQITAGLDDDYEKVQAIHDWVIDNIYYDYVQYNEPLGAIVYTKSDEQKLTAAGFGSASSEFFLPDITVAENTAVLQRGVCRGYARLTCELIRAQSIPCLYISGYANLALSQDMIDKHSSSHAWNAAFVDGRWVYIDTTWDSFNDYRDGVYYKSPITSHEYFDISLKELSDDHYFSEFGSTKETDIPSTWAQNSVWFSIKAGFVPNNLQQAYQTSITRQQFCQLLYQFLNVVCPDMLNNNSGTSPFKDVNDQSVTATYQLGIVSGMDGNRFAPEQSITRQEAATMLSRLAEVLKIPTVQPSISFANQRNIADWARQSINQVIALGIMESTDIGFDPLSTYTIEQAIVTIERVNSLL